MLSIHIKHDSTNTSRYIYTEPHHSFMLQITFTVIAENHKLLINSRSTNNEFIYFLLYSSAYCLYCNCISPCRGTFQSGGSWGTVCELLKNCQALLHAESFASVCPWEQLHLIWVSEYLWWKAVCGRYCTYCTYLRKKKKMQNYHWGGTL